MMASQQPHREERPRHSAASTGESSRKPPSREPGILMGWSPSLWIMLVCMMMKPASPIMCISHPVRVESHELCTQPVG